MAKLDITNPAIIRLLNEAYDKEKQLRSYWVSKNTDKILLAATLQREPTNYYQEDVIKHSMIKGMAAITRDHAAAGRNRKTVPIRDTRAIPGIESLRHENSIIKVGLGDAKEDPRLSRPDTDVSPDPIMRPVDSNTKSIIYQSKPEFGRVVYLHHRSKLDPEKRYYFPECVSWDHGWRFKDSNMKQRATYGRDWILQRTLNNRTGFLPDPPHYKPPVLSNYEQCSF